MLEDFFINASTAKKKKKKRNRTSDSHQRDVRHNWYLRLWVCSLKLLVNMCPDFSQCSDLTFKFVELLGEFIKQEAKVRAAEMSPRRSAPSCDVVTDVTGQIDAACKCFYTLQRRYRDVCCHPLLCSQLGKESVYQTLFICCQHPPPSIRPLLTDTDWVLLVKLYARLHSSRQTTTPLCPLIAASLSPSLALTPLLGRRLFFWTLYV